MNDKKVEHSYFLKDLRGEIRPLSSELFARVIKLSKENADTSCFEVDYGQVYVCSVFDKLTPADVDVFSPLKRYFVKVKVQVAGASTEQIVEIEVPREVFEQEGNSFDASLSDSPLFTGNWSLLKGEIQSREKVNDPNYVLASFKDGPVIVIPRRFVAQQ